MIPAGCVEFHDVVREEREIADQRVVEILRNSDLLASAEQHLDVEQCAQTMEGEECIRRITITRETSSDAIDADVMCWTDKRLSKTSMYVLGHALLEQQVVDLCELEDARFQTRLVQPLHVAIYEGVVAGDVGVHQDNRQVRTCPEGLARVGAQRVDLDTWPSNEKRPNVVEDRHAASAGRKVTESE